MARLRKKQLHRSLAHPAIAMRHARHKLQAPFERHLALLRLGLCVAKEILPPRQPKPPLRHRLWRAWQGRVVGVDVLIAQQHHQGPGKQGLQARGGVGERRGQSLPFAAKDKD